MAHLGTYEDTEYLRELYAQGHPDFMEQDRHEAYEMEFRDSFFDIIEEVLLNCSEEENKLSLFYDETRLKLNIYNWRVPEFPDKNFIAISHPVTKQELLEISITESRKDDKSADVLGPNKEKFGRVIKYSNRDYRISNYVNRKHYKVARINSCLPYTFNVIDPYGRIAAKVNVYGEVKNTIEIIENFTLIFTKEVEASGVDKALIISCFVIMAKTRFDPNKKEHHGHTCILLVAIFFLLLGMTIIVLSFTLNPRESQESS